MALGETRPPGKRGLTGFVSPPVNLSDSRIQTLQSAGQQPYGQPMPAETLYPRFPKRRLTEALADSPAVLIYARAGRRAKSASMKTSASAEHLDLLFSK